MAEWQDASGTRGHAAQVFYPSNTDEVSEITRAAAKSHVGITVAGANTGLAGGSVPAGDWCVSLSRLRRTSINKSTARCEAGVTLDDLASAAARHKLFLGPNPTEITASVGGAVSTNAGGARSFRYGSMRRQLLAAEAVMADGEIRHFVRGDKVDFPYSPVPQPDTTKNSAGYFMPPRVDWIDLLAGSEGTLAIITAVDIQLQPEPPSILSAVVFFTEDFLAVDAICSWRKLEELRLLEYMDRRALEFVRLKTAEVPVGAEAAVFVEQNIYGQEADVLDAWLSRLEEAGADEEHSWFGVNAADRERFRALRHHLPVSVLEHSQIRNMPKLGTDYAVPFGYMRQIHQLYREECRKVLEGKFTIFGHAGDANNHINFLPDSQSEANAATELTEALARQVASVRGTIAAEHGVGKRKRHLLPLMYSVSDLDAMVAVKKRLDPHLLLGRGNIFLPELL